MKRMLSVLLLSMLLGISLVSAQAEMAQEARVTELMEIEAYDGYALQGKLDLPASGSAGQTRLVRKRLRPEHLRQPSSDGRDRV